MKPNKILRLSIILLLVIVALPTYHGTQASDYSYTVVSTLPSGVGTLAWAINQANTHTDPADNVMIAFNLPLIDPNYDPVAEVWTITPTAVLPLLIGSNTTIDGYTQPGAVLPTEDRSPTLKVVIDGSALPNNALSIGLGILSSNNVVRGLVIQNFPSNGIALGLPSIVVTNNIISGNCIGTDHECAHDEGNQGDGVYIGGGAKNNIIGGDSPEEKNYILFNKLDGIGIYGGNTSDNVVSGNIILSNKTHGIRIYGGSHHNTIGGTSPNQRNLISGNTKDGIRIQGSGTDENVILGNYIGTSSDGYSEISNRDNGIQITEGAQENTIGGAADGAMNLISSNHDYGVVITGTETMSNTVLGNIVGTDVSGGSAIGNGHAGIAITGGANHNFIGGGSDHDAFNLVSGNDTRGILLSDPGTSHNTIAGNYIGTNISGTLAVGNDGYGVHIKSGASENLIGGDLESAFNLISGNLGKGVFIYGPDAHGNTIAGNYIGTDISGTEVISNTTGGVLINNGAYENVVGGDTPDEMNLISGNGGAGVFIELESHNNSIIGNTIGTDITGMAALGNKYEGVSISRSANTEIGGTSPGEGNLISANGYAGVAVNFEESSGNLIAGNKIGTDKTGIAALPNSYGVSIGRGAVDNTIGGTTSSAGNLISGNKLAGIFISGEGTSGNTVIGNLLGTDSSGLQILKNREGVYITGGAQNNTIGGETEAERNVICGNRNSGLTISGDTTTGNDILNNYIGVGVDGIKPLGNASSGLYVSSSNNVFGPGNIIAHNWLEGIYVHDETALNNVITQNSIHSNGHEDYYRYGIRLEDGAHGDIQPPEIVSANASGAVSGTACSDCEVELFWSQKGEGQGEVYLGSTTATASGAFDLSVTYPGAFNLTATATDTRGTSEFSEVYNPVYFSYLPITLGGD
jgi:titin